MHINIEVFVKNSDVGFTFGTLRKLDVLFCVWVHQRSISIPKFVGIFEHSCQAYAFLVKSLAWANKEITLELYPYPSKDFGLSYLPTYPLG